MNGPSLETSRVKKEWLQIGKELLESYPSGIKCSCGKADFDFGNTNMIAKHLIFNPKHTLKVKTFSRIFLSIDMSEINGNFPAGLPDGEIMFENPCPDRADT